MADISSASVILIVSLTGMPICLACNWAQDHLQPTTIFLIGGICLALIVAVIHAFRDKSKPLDPLYYVFGICCFSSVVDLLIALENDGVISGFVEFYLKRGEPYLGTAHGTMICYWDGTVHYAMYITMLMAMTWGQSYRVVGLLWSGSIINSVIVLLLGNVLGDHEVKVSYLLNVPFILAPMYALGRFLSQRQPDPTLTKEEVNKYHTSIIRRPLDLLCVGLCITGIIIGFFRGCVALSWTPNTIFRQYIDLIEPYIKDPVFYPTLQMLTYMFYFVPFYTMCIYGLISSGHSWMLDWVLVFAGAIGQGQFSYMGAAVHKSTPIQYRIPCTSLAQSTFLLVNFLPIICSLLLAYRCTFTENYFFVQHPTCPEDLGKSLHGQKNTKSSEGLLTNRSRKIS